MNRILQVLVVVLAAIVGEFAQGDVTVKQPTPGADDKVRIPSPMILEMPLPTADPERVGKGEQRPKDLQDLKRYACEGVTYKDVSIIGRKMKNGDIKSTLKFLLHVEPGIDKLVTVRVEVHSGGELVGLGVIRDIDAEEGKTALREVHVTIPAAALVPEKTPTLRLTMTVIPNA